MRANIFIATHRTHTHTHTHNIVAAASTSGVVNGCAGQNAPLHRLELLPPERVVDHVAGRV